MLEFPKYDYDCECLQICVALGNHFEMCYEGADMLVHRRCSVEIRQRLLQEASQSSVVSDIELNTAKTAQMALELNKRVEEISKGLADERVERKAADEESKRYTKKTFRISASIAIAALLVSILTLIFNSFFPGLPTGFITQETPVVGDVDDEGGQCEYDADG